MERALLWLGPLALLIGLATPQLWEARPLERAQELLVLGLLATGLSWLPARFWRGTQASWAAALWVLLLCVLAGPVPVLATAVFALATLAIGGLLLPRGPAGLQTVLGLLVTAGGLGWLLMLPIHFGWLYLLAAIALVALRYKALATTLHAAGSQWRQAVNAAPRLATLCVIVIGLAAASCWLPTLQYDDLAYHLRLPWQLQQQGFYSPAPEQQVWAFAPWASDVVQAIAQLMAHQEARGPVNALWLLLLAGGLWQLAARLGAPAAGRWLAAAVALSQPLTTALAGGMQTELPIATVLAWLFAVVAGPRDGSLRFWLTVAVLCGGLAAIKTSAAVMAVVPLAWALCRHPWPSLPRIALVLLLGLLVAGSSYAHGQILAGNPVLPLFNGWFQSPYYAPTHFFDDRWHSGFGPSLLWRMSFHTDRYVEAYAGGGSFVLVALFGPWLLALCHRTTRVAAIAATLVLVLPLLPLQYLRYAYPGLVVLSAVLVTAMFHANLRQATWIAIGVCVLHLCFQSSAHWMLRYGAIKQTVKAGGRDAPLFERFAPERSLARAIRDAGGPHGNVLVLETEQSFFAEFGTRGRTISWYSRPLSLAAARAAKDPSGRAWLALMRKEGISDVLLRGDSVTPAQRAALKRARAEHRSTVQEAEWWSLPVDRAP
ncbi:hypothetical protein [Stenotrophomonas mori]|uniref:Glycosyltransferase RgtA/B/C/D-like domain-containing protein n=1 Tax=Stenotrophomonas mori TaxID=2871096 RepID=A0ABT0SK21_9GAMM|nr:hypothetical protein [Stenotrophomonas mori]MCL7715264.1 hypothetical protein [Stenotrophomonas mori]